MKIREMHVSNSSSSSSVLITTKSNYERSLEKADPFTRAVATALAQPIKNKFLGQELVAFVEYMDNGGNGTFDWLDVEYEEGDEDRDEYEDDKGEAWERFQKILNEKPEEVTGASADW